MFHKKTMEGGPGAAKRVQQNVKNLPITSVALAGLLGAGAIALAARMGAFAPHKDTKGV